MRKTLLILLLLIIALGALSWIGWERRASIAAQLIQKHLGGTPVTLNSLEFNDNGAELTKFVVKNPRGFRSPTAFTAERITIDTTWNQLRADPLTIDLIRMDNLLVTIEENKKGKMNWDAVLEGGAKQKPGGRSWLIKTLILNNLTVRVVKADGSSKTYPTLSRREFHNLSDETGFPVSAIEKAIFNEVMKNLFRNLDLQKILQPAIPGGQYISSFPKLF
jgi:hypothetical protein